MKRNEFAVFLALEDRKGEEQTCKRREGGYALRNWESSARSETSKGMQKWERLTLGDAKTRGSMPLIFCFLDISVFLFFLHSVLSACLERAISGRREGGGKSEDGDRDYRMRCRRAA